MALSHILHALYRGFWSKRRLVSVWIGAVAALSAAVVVGVLATAGNTTDNAGASPPHDVEQSGPCLWYIPIELDRSSGAALYADTAAAATARYPTHHDDQGGQPTLPAPPPPPTPPQEQATAANRLTDIARESEPDHDSLPTRMLQQAAEIVGAASSVLAPEISPRPSRPTPPPPPTPERPVPTETPDPVVNSPVPTKQWPW